jgi:antitoxin component YwqK of YwqJK toxin-antitoxin module
METDILKDRLQNSYLGDINLYRVVRQFIYEILNDYIEGPYVFPSLCTYEECEYRYDKRYGICKFITEYEKEINIVSESNYKNDMLHGEDKHYYNDGSIKSICTYIEDKLDGDYKKWWPNGNLKEQCVYVKGKKEGEYKRWNESGNLIYTCNYKNGLRQGKCREWDINGLVKEYNYKDDIFHGKYEEWNNGIKLLECNYIIKYKHEFLKRISVNDDDIKYFLSDLEGEYKQWNEDGLLVIHRTYDKGKVIKDHINI